VKTKEMRLDDVMPMILAQLERGKSVRFNPRGTSMLPMLRQGRDGVLLSPLPEKLKKYDLPLYRRANGQYVLHRIVKAGDTYTAIGDNQFETEPGLTHAQMIAVVTAFYRDDREISVQSLSHRAYCRLWHYTRGLRQLYRRGKGFLKRSIRFTTRNGG